MNCHYVAQRIECFKWMYGVKLMHGIQCVELLSVCKMYRI